MVREGLSQEVRSTWQEAAVLELGAEKTASAKAQREEQAPRAG